ncbi:YcxB family protein [Erythrobacter sp. HKB08]|uniref:YcxB family protein n=1 Tax=Erythrobacter sp. HKB08 TaxID=2502843 RepID=UPI001008EA3A|nr:YcxB family protein [Erythrobacter sp. HKB08]
MEQGFSRHYEPTEQDAVAATKAVWWRYMTKPSSIIGFLVLFGLLVVMLNVFLDRQIPLWIMLVAVVGGLAITLALTALVMAPAAGRRHYQQAAHLQKSVNVTWDETSIRFDVERGSSSYEWREFHRWSMSGEHLLLFLTDDFVMSVPRRVLADGEPVAVGGLLHAGVRKI